MKPEPKVRKDAKCARYPECKKPLQRITARHRRYGGDALTQDPFCSRPCAEIYYGTRQVYGKSAS